MSATDRKQKEFYLVQFRKKISEDRRLQERWREQALRRSEQQGIESESLSRTTSYDEKIQSLNALMTSLTVDTPAFVEYYEQQRSMADRAVEIRLRKKEESIQEEQERKAKVDSFYADRRQANRTERRQKKDIVRDWDYLHRVEESVPGYIRENLSNMPNNKGYIWRGVQYFGALPHQGPANEWVMFERKGNRNLVHEVRYGHYHRVFEKGDRNRPKKLLEEWPCKFRT